MKLIKAEGKINDKPHVFPVRVYFEDTDAGGIVYYANYLRFAERARSEMFRLLGIESGKMIKDWGILFAVKRCFVDFIKPAKLDDLLLVKTRLIEIGGASVRANQDITLNGLNLVCMDLKLVCISNEGKPARMPISLRKLLNSF
jgi:acyl-CoA thioester hydrolase|tara:strand:- start:423 stop:854 length:432 start_codon:yes stop_codon:yes gene_type:complete